jgi:hypothetical protein
MRFINKNGTSDRQCNCGTWIQHWLNFSNSRVKPICSVYGCATRAEVGAHVMKSNSTDKSTYIIPMCRSHNNSTQEFDIKASTILVPASVKDTCG